jgi:hypothetical protein
MHGTNTTDHLREQASAPVAHTNARHAEITRISKPVDPFHRRVFDIVDGPQRARQEWATAADGFGLEQPDRRLRESVIVGVADTADRCRDPF